MARVLDGIPDPSDQDRWREELRRALLEFEGRPLKQFRESKQLVRAAERLVDVYASPPTRRRAVSQVAASDPGEQVGTEIDAGAPLARQNRRALVGAMENLSYPSVASWSFATAWEENRNTVPRK